MPKGILSFLNVAPDVPRITDPEKMQKSYKYWRFRVMYAMLFGYIGFYFVRKSLAVAMPVIEQEFNIPKAHLGLILTAFGVTYGISKFINGFAGDRTNPRYFMALGLICSAVINVFFGLSSGVIAFGIFWILNGWFQGMGWAPNSSTLVNWYSAKERGVRFSITKFSCFDWGFWSCIFKWIFNCAVWLAILFFRPGRNSHTGSIICFEPTS